MHWDRLQKGMKALSMDMHPHLNKENIINLTNQLILENKISGAARIRLQVYRKDGGTYAPLSNEIDFLLQCFPIDAEAYSLNKKGLSIGIAKEIIHNMNSISHFKTTNKLEMVLCAIQAQKNNWDDALLCNPSGFLTESSKSNLFLIKNNTIYTPPIGDGPLNGVMRQRIIQICQNKNINCIEVHLKEADLLEADEVFLTNAIIGVQWVVAFKNKRYFNTMCRLLSNYLNESIL